MSYPEERKRYDEALDEASFHRARYRNLTERIDQVFKNYCNECGKWKTGDCPVDCPVDKIKEQITKEPRGGK